MFVAGVRSCGMFKKQSMNTELLESIELALAGKWDSAHSIVQRYEEDETAAWIHAVLHKIEGDASNSRYWYRRAGKLTHEEDDPHAELKMIRSSAQAT